MDSRNSKKPARRQPNPDAERRKVGLVVHDDRGNASVSWRDAPADYDRPVLEVLGEPQLTVKTEETYDPYARHTQRSSREGAGGGAQVSSGNRDGGDRGGGNRRSDLRKLSEWIKMMREREQRKRKGGREG